MSGWEAWTTMSGGPERVVTNEPDPNFKAHAEAKSRWNYFHMFREWLDQWGERPSGPPKQTCAGECISTADRALFARLADEVDAYLTTDADEGLFA